ncbi:hypothetical protein IFM89_026338 [Coptis chinensis]|uniref:Protein TILLER ANGLE CONTROL 1 n=1 Tax=Coptis chinensis TaxID=261450 RepID=A0A835HQB6_9MAGN|nr:hypothetical protein IFM89_026338 [Coptis chinensis]
MKIFNWMHRKFHHNADGYMVSPKKDELAYNNVDKCDTVTNETDTKALLDQVTLMDIWKDGILTIGTFGFDHDQIEYCMDKEEDEENNEEEECPVNREGQLNQLNPLVVKVVNPEPKIDVIDAKIQVHVEQVPETTPLLEMPEIRRRVTLADLLSADVDVTEKLHPVEVLESIGKKSAKTEKNSKTEKKSKASFGKKGKGNDSHPTKLHRMISKVLKKKIHPDLEGKIHGKDGLNDPSEKTLLKDGGRIEMVSLLQDAVSQS